MVLFVVHDQIATTWNAGVGLEINRITRKAPKVCNRIGFYCCSVVTSNPSHPIAVSWISDFIGYSDVELPGESKSVVKKGAFGGSRTTEDDFPPFSAIL